MLLQAKKKVFQNATSPDKERTPSPIVKELHPDTRYVNSAYVGKNVSMKDKFNRELHKSTVAAVKKFDNTNEHRSNKKQSKIADKFMDSSSDDDDY